ncbi:hypothetical protein [Amycolatopsis vastitatis]|uniref:Uncharacterized protein n=1 Tax=Amycolatopsis vastitatis TaxID=1905142 RepID=A0A229SN69_9PSEU|nr:hypothetical protein [Amycolatopsis vastitatis]OXM60475.1 hypothetical protein CF165_42385 [Amycolatopsis vastitatis]
MFRDPTLEAVGVAGYRWGSFLLETTALFPVDGRGIVETFAGASALTLPFETDVRMRAAIALLHELVHLKQDLASGIGAHDHLVTRHAAPRLVEQSKWFFGKFDRQPYREAALRILADLDQASFTDQVRGDLAAVEDRTIGLRQLRGAAWRTPATSQVLTDMLGPNVELDNLSEHPLRRVLEAEAACETYLHVMRSKVSDIGVDLLHEREYLWNPILMGEDYSSGIISVALATDREVGSDQIRRGMRAYAALSSWIAEFAVAYPPPAILADWRLSRAYFDPVVRYLLALRALGDMSEPAYETLLEAVLDRRWDDFDDTLRAYMRVEYPSTRDIYTAWLDELEPLATGESWDAPLFALRTAMLRSRLSDTRETELGAVFTAQIPIQVIGTGTGLRGIMWGQQLYDDKLKRALLDWNVDRDLYELFYGSGMFRCIFARSQVCKSRQPRCATGMTLLSQLPPEEGCQVRRVLHELGYNI